MSENTRKERPVLSSVRPQPLPEPGGTLERLFQDHHRLVYQTAYRITGRGQDAEDVLQTIFLRLARRERLPELSPTPVYYLRRAAVNAALDVVRSRRPGAPAIEDLEPRLADGRQPDPESRHGNAELRDELRRAVSRLSPRAAEVVSLRYFEGYRNHEIAKMLGTSRTTIAVILHRARHQLRDSLRHLAEVTP
jgi:RNA polymerase sigma-70 factor (ECF subfamily)